MLSKVRQDECIRSPVFIAEYSGRALHVGVQPRLVHPGVEEWLQILMQDNIRDYKSAVYVTSPSETVCVSQVSAPRRSVV